MSYPSIDESQDGLRRAGWTARDTVRPGANIWKWVVTAFKDERVVEAKGDTQEEAWYLARQEAEAIDAGTEVKQV